METVAHGGEKLNSRHCKLTIQDYIFIVNNINKLDDLTCDQLNQIIDIHGYKKMHKLAKNTLCEAVNTMELLKLSRSTVKSNGLSSDAVVSVDDVTKDLSELSWTECTVTSLEMINSVEHIGKSTPSVLVSNVKPLNKLRKLMSGSKNESVGGLDCKEKVKRMQIKTEKVSIDGVNNGLKSGYDIKGKAKSQQKKVIGKVNNNKSGGGGGGGARVERQEKKQKELVTEVVKKNSNGGGGSRLAACSSVVNGGEELKLTYKRRRFGKDKNGGGPESGSKTKTKPEIQKKKQREVVTENVRGGAGSNGGGGGSVIKVKPEIQQKIKTEVVTEGGDGLQTASYSSVINGGDLRWIYKRRNRV